MNRLIKAALTTAVMSGIIVVAIKSFAQENVPANAPPAPTPPAAMNVNPAERAKIEEVVHQYLISKPEVILEAMQVLQNKQFEQAKKSVLQTQKDAPRFINPLFHENNDPMTGNPKGKVTVVEFFDYQCPHCVDMAPIMEALVKANPELRLVFKEWPIRGPVSEFASKAALAANKQGKYYEFYRALLAAPQPLTQDGVLTVAKNVGLDVEKLKKDMNETSIDSKLKANMKLAQDLKLFGTPAFFIGLTNTTAGPINYAPGEMTQAQLQDAIDKAGK